MPQLDLPCLIRVDEFVGLLLYFDEPEARRRLVKDALVLWKPDGAPKRLYQRILKLSERRVAAWPPGLFLQLQVLQMAEVRQVGQEKGHRAGIQPIPEAVFVERFIQKLVIASMAIPSDVAGGAVGARRRRETRNVYTLCVALCQVLRDYTSGQARAIYQASTQSDDDRSDNAHSVTRRKVMDALLDRFNDFLREEQLANGERRLTRQERRRQELWQPVVRSTLSYLSPWGAKHVLGRPYRPGVVMPELTVLRGLSKESWHVLANCATALICPECFANLTAHLLFPIGHREEPVPRPGDVLAVPVFFNLSAADPPDRPERSRGRDDLEDLKLLVEVHEERRRARKKRGMRLAVVVDDLPPVEHDLVGGGAELAFDVAEKATYLRVYSRDEEGDLLLAGASIRRAWYGGEEVRERLVGLGGQTVELLVTPPSSEGVGPAPAKVRLKYYEAFWGKRLSLKWDRAWHRLWTTYAGRPYRLAARVALLLTVAGLLVFALLNLRPRSPEQVVVTPTAPPQPGASSPTPAATPEGQNDEGRQPSPTPHRDGGPSGNKEVAPELARRFPPRNAKPAEPFDPAVRAPGVSETLKRLREVKKIFVRVEGPAELALRVRPTLEAALTSDVVILKPGEESGADAHLIIQLDSKGTATFARARLVNRDGEVIWPARSAVTVQRATANVEEIGGDVGRALSGDMKRAAGVVRPER